MSGYLVRRLMISVPTLLIIVTVAFFMMRVAPGGPFDQERALPPEIERNMLAAYNLDAPLVAQYWDYLKGVVRGDFGPSFKYRDFTVAELLLQGFPASLRVGGMAIALAVVVGIRRTTGPSLPSAASLCCTTVCPATRASSSRLVKAQTMSSQS